jgi:hypothetical protein
MPGDEITLPIVGRDTQEEVKNFLRSRPTTGPGQELRDAVHSVQRVDTESKGGIRREIAGGLRRLREDTATLEQRAKQKANEAGETIGVGPLFNTDQAGAQVGAPDRSENPDTVSTAVRDP